MNEQTEVIPQQWDVLVIGAGPSGTVAAAILRQKGYTVKIVEKQTFPRFVIGESLLPRCMDNLEEAGLLDAVKSAGFQKKYGARFVRDGQVCDFDFSTQFTKGWTWTWQVKRAEFDQLLAAETEKKGVAIAYNTEVISVDFDAEGHSSTLVQLPDGTEEKIQAKFLVDASGYGRVLPRLLGLDEPSGFPERASLFCHLEDDARPQNGEGNRITYIVYEQDVWIWVIPFSDGSTSVGIVGNKERITRFDGSTTEQFTAWLQEIPALKSRFEGRKHMFEPRLITGYATSVKQLFGKGYVLTGNSTEFLDPVFSSGVTLATESGALAARLIHRELQEESVDWEQEYTAYLLRGVDVFRSFVTSWYDGDLQKIFFTSESNSGLKNQICSVLAGYVWDEENVFVRKHARAVKALANVL